MSLRYLLVPEGPPHMRDEVHARLTRSAGWHSVLLGPRLLLVNDPSQLMLVPGGGAILGTLFRTGLPSVRVRSLNERDRHLLEADPRVAGRAFWGSYVMLSAEGAGLTVRRDPSGSLPCLLLGTGQDTVVMSDVGLIDLLGWKRPRVALDRVVRTLWTANLPDSATALEGVEDLQPGTEVAIAATGREVRQWWSPWDHVEERSGSDAEWLRSLVQDAVKASCASYGRLLLGVSGGLDSSVVAACLASGCASLTCFTTSTLDAHGDERIPARVLAQHLGLELLERWYPSDAQDLGAPWTSASRSRAAA